MFSFFLSKSSILIKMISCFHVSYFEKQKLPNSVIKTFYKHILKLKPSGQFVASESFLMPYKCGFYKLTGNLEHHPVSVWVNSSVSWQDPDVTPFLSIHPLAAHPAALLLLSCSEKENAGQAHETTSGSGALSFIHHTHYGLALQRKKAVTSLWPADKRHLLKQHTAGNWGFMQLWEQHLNLSLMTPGLSDAIKHFHWTEMPTSQKNKNIDLSVNYINH